MEAHIEIGDLFIKYSTTEQNTLQGRSKEEFYINIANQEVEEE